jgi:Arc/MetJ-type ribon-helix-helix transcriptional regulator
MTTITVPITKELEGFIKEEILSGTSETKAGLVRHALSRLQEERALSRLQEAERDITQGKVYKGDLKSLCKKMK